jgi:hypothetical protein
MFHVKRSEATETRQTTEVEGVRFAKSNGENIGNDSACASDTESRDCPDKGVEAVGGISRRLCPSRQLVFEDSETNCGADVVDPSLFVQGGDRFGSCSLPDARGYTSDGESGADCAEDLRHEVSTLIAFSDNPVCGPLVERLDCSTRPLVRGGS